jgi:hypothetical protein
MTTDSIRFFLADECSKRTPYSSNCRRSREKQQADQRQWSNDKARLLESKVKAKVQAASAATIDRLLAPCRITLGSRGRCGTRPGTLLRSQIPIRTEHWEVEWPGGYRSGHRGALRAKEAHRISKLPATH